MGFHSLYVTRWSHRRARPSSAPSDPDDARDALATWLRSNEDGVRRIVETATDEFEDVVLGELEALFETAWDGAALSEREVVDPTAVQQAETYERVRELLDDTGGRSLWSRLRDAGEELRAEHPDSPTTDAVESALASTRPPTERRVQQLLERANDPQPPGPDDDTWAELRTVAEELRRELPNAEVTDEVTAVVDAGDRPSEERVTALLSEAKPVLDRIRAVNETLDGLEDGSIVLLED